MVPLPTAACTGTEGLDEAVAVGVAGVAVVVVVAVAEGKLEVEPTEPVKSGRRFGSDDEDRCGRERALTSDDDDVVLETRLNWLNGSFDETSESCRSCSRGALQSATRCTMNLTERTTAFVVSSTYTLSRIEDRIVGYCAKVSCIGRAVDLGNDGRRLIE